MSAASSGARSSPSPAAATRPPDSVASSRARSVDRLQVRHQRGASRSSLRSSTFSRPLARHSARCRRPSDHEQGCAGRGPGVRALRARRRRGPAGTLRGPALRQGPRRRAARGLGGRRGGADGTCRGRCRPPARVQPRQVLPVPAPSRHGPAPRRRRRASRRQRACAAPEASAPPPPRVPAVPASAGGSASRTRGQSKECPPGRPAAVRPPAAPAHRQHGSRPRRRSAPHCRPAPPGPRARRVTCAGAHAQQQRAYEPMTRTAARPGVRRGGSAAQQSLAAAAGFHPRACQLARAKPPRARGHVSSRLRSLWNEQREACRLASARAGHAAARTDPPPATAILHECRCFVIEEIRRNHRGFHRAICSNAAPPESLLFRRSS